MLPADAFGEVDYDPDDLEDPVKQEEEQPAPEEGAASSSAPPEVATEEGADEEGFGKVVRKRGTRGGGDVKKKSFKRNFHQVGVPEARDWLARFTRFYCGQAYRLNTPYLQESPDFPPLVRYLGHFRRLSVNLLWELLGSYNITQRALRDSCITTAQDCFRKLAC